MKTFQTGQITLSQLRTFTHANHFGNLNKYKVNVISNENNIKADNESVLLRISVENYL